MTAPFVSVVVPAWNVEAYVGEALASLLREPGIRAEIVVVDDGSTDATAARVEAVAAAEPRVRLLRQPNAGVARARNVGLAAAGGDFITFLDADDICYPGRIERQWRKLADAPDAIAVVGEMLLFERLDAALQPVAGTRSVRVPGISLTTALFRRAAFERYGPLDESLRAAEDLDFFLRLIETKARLLYEPELAIFYRRHAGNMTNAHDKITRAVIQAIQRSLARRRLAGDVTPIDPAYFERGRAERLFDGG
jgi:glycosyltransferase involved in cell wall biosynthesis